MVTGVPLFNDEVWAPPQSPLSPKSEKAERANAQLFSIDLRNAAKHTGKPQPRGRRYLGDRQSARVTVSLLRVSTSTIRSLGSGPRREGAFVMRSDGRSRAARSRSLEIRSSTAVPKDVRRWDGLGYKSITAAHSRTFSMITIVCGTPRAVSAVLAGGRRTAGCWFCYQNPLDARLADRTWWRS